MQVFDKRDKEYFEWMESHPEGYVLNTERSVGTKYFIIHKANCYTVSYMESRPKDSYTSKSWIKVCSDNITDLASYCKGNKKGFNGSFTYCGACKPSEAIFDFVDKTELNDLKSNYLEGKTMRILVNAYERNGLARKRCIEIKGVTCKCCGLNFEKTYGPIGKGFIHVHHLKPLSLIKAGYEVDPEKDLVPVCPNCHSMIHMNNPPYSIEELQSIMNAQKK